MVSGGLDRLAILMKLGERTRREKTPARPLHFHSYIVCREFISSLGPTAVLNGLADHPRSWMQRDRLSTTSDWTSGRYHARFGHGSMGKSSLADYSSGSSLSMTSTLTSCAIFCLINSCEVDTANPKPESSAVGCRPINFFTASLVLIHSWSSPDAELVFIFIGMPTAIFNQQR